VKLAIPLALALILNGTGTVYAFEPTTSNTPDLDAMTTLKDSQAMGVPDPQRNVGGEDIASAVPIPAWPYTDSGNTCDYLNDYDEVCPESNSTSPDVVYSLSPDSDKELNISLCTSLYDTKLYIYENAAGNLIACNDDACGDDGFKSELNCVPMTRGNTYYIVVDGWGGDCGTYNLAMDECVLCEIDCPPWSVLEGEPDCEPNYDDITNGGCNSTPNVFTNLACSASITVCGTYGGFLYNGLSYRDTDWYEYPAWGNKYGITVCVKGEYGTLFGYRAKDCGTPFFEAFRILGPCQEGCLDLPPGDWWIFVATLIFAPSAGGGACGGDYIMTIDGLRCGTVEVESATWGEIKNDYR
jgi:hypothetical protein